jgi:hypothetical protein
VIDGTTTGTTDDEPQREIDDTAFIGRVDDTDPPVFEATTAAANPLGIDWAATDVIASAKAGQDVALPAPFGPHNVPAVNGNGRPVVTATVPSRPVPDVPAPRPEPEPAAPIVPDAEVSRPGPNVPDGDVPDIETHPDLTNVPVRYTTEDRQVLRQHGKALVEARVKRGSMLTGHAVMGIVHNQKRAAVRIALAVERYMILQGRAVSTPKYLEELAKATGNQPAEAEAAAES